MAGWLGLGLHSSWVVGCGDAGENSKERRSSWQAGLNQTTPSSYYLCVFCTLLLLSFVLSNTNHPTNQPQQVHSAMISAGLGGHLDVLLELKQYSDPALYAKPAGGAGDDDDDDYDDSTADKTEL